MLLGGHRKNAQREGELPFPPSEQGSGAQQEEAAGPEGTTKSSVAFGKGQEGRGSNLRSLNSPLSEVLVGVEADQEVDSGWFLKCGTCGNASRRVGEAKRESKGIQELFKRGKAFEEAGEGLAARRCFEQALKRAETWLHNGNWVLSEIYSTLASVCVGLQVKCVTVTTPRTARRACVPAASGSLASSSRWCSSPLVSFHVY